MTEPVAAQRDLLDRVAIGAGEVAAVEAQVAALLDTACDVLLIQAEATVALEAAAKSIGRPGVRALNVVTGPYGALFGRWLAVAGADVRTVEVPYRRAVQPAEISRVLAAQDVDLVSVVHAEAATGSANPIDEIAGMVRAAGALLLVDAVASIGAHPVRPDAWSADVVVVGGQKALAGPAGVSALTISPRAWDAMSANPNAPCESILSLLDLRERWLRTDRTTVPGTPSSLETLALGQALTRVAAEGMPQVVRRHRAAAAAARAGVRELGLELWVESDRAAATVVTTVAAPSTESVSTLVASARAAGSALLGPAPGSLADTTLRINHTGQAARVDLICRELAALAVAVGLDAQCAVDAARRAWDAQYGAPAQ